MSASKSILVLGGTSWLGGAVAARAVALGYEVTCLARGESGEVPDGAAHVRANRWSPSAYDEVAQRTWDTVVDLSWQPDLVRSALQVLSDRTEHWVYVSSVSVYADHTSPGGDETATLLEPWRGSGEASLADYGPAKVSCETACHDLLASERLLVARSGLVVGYGDRSDRFGYWPGRFARAAGATSGHPGVLVPPLHSPVQVIDVDDLASWLVDAGSRRVAGTVDAIGDTHTFAEVAEACATAAGTRPRMVSPGDAWLQQQGVEPWAGPESLPLWLPASHAGMASRSGGRAREVGLEPRPLPDSVASALRWETELGLERARKAGLSPTREGELLGRLPAPSF